MHEIRERYVNPFTDFGFKKLFEVAEVTKFTREELLSYEDSLKYYRDLKNSLDTAFDEGFEEGKEKGREEGKIEGKMEVIKNDIKAGAIDKVCT